MYNIEQLTTAPCPEHWQPLKEWQSFRDEDTAIYCMQRLEEDLKIRDLRVVDTRTGLVVQYGLPTV